MRKNTQDAIAAFRRCQPSPRSRQGSAIWTDGETLFSYRTPLMTALRCWDGARSFTYVLNRTRYSVTTTIHQNGLAEYFRGSDVLEVDDVPRGCSVATLVERGKGASMARRLQREAGDALLAHAERVASLPRFQ